MKVLTATIDTPIRRDTERSVRPRATRPAALRSRSSAARRSLVFGVLTFLAVQAGLNLGIRTQVFPDPDPMYEEKCELLAKHPTFHANPSAVKVLALGSSRTQIGFHSSRFADRLRDEGRSVEAFNFGTPAAGAVVCSLYLRRLLEAGMTPDHLVLEVHPGFLTPLTPVFEGRWLQPYRLRPDETALIRGYGWDLPDPPQHGWRGWLTSVSVYRFSLLNRYAHKWLPSPYGLTVGNANDPSGWLRGPDVPRSEYPKMLKRAWDQYADTFADYHVGGPGCAAVRDMLALCRDRGIRATVVFLPESSEYREWYGAGYEEIGRFGGELTAEFGVPVLDARGWLADTDFSDGHHLTPNGALVYTDRLAAEWKTIHLTTGDASR